MLHLTDRGALCLGEYCRKVGFGVDGGPGVGYGNCLAPSRTPDFANAQIRSIRMMIVSLYDICLFNIIVTIQPIKRYH